MIIIYTPKYPCITGKPKACTDETANKKVYVRTRWLDLLYWNSQILN